jgi:ubiquitin-activating enzyme E1
MKVLIVGLRGVGVETAKNLILAGPNTVTLYDPTTVSIEDLSANFYLNEEHVGKINRSQASCTKLQELNSYVKVNVAEELPDFSQFSVVCVTENFEGFGKLIEYNQRCR